MDSPSALLQQLRIDRDDAPRPPSGGRRRWFGIAIVGIVLAASAIAWVSGRSTAVPEPVHTETSVPPAAPAQDTSAASIALDASGYVVARRQATVSSKATGRVAEVLIEEGQRVEQGQVIARLDASSASAELAEAAARVAHSQAD